MVGENPVALKETPSLRPKVNSLVSWSYVTPVT